MSRRLLSWTAFWVAALGLGLAVVALAAAEREPLEAFCSPASSSWALGLLAVPLVGVALLLAVVAAVRSHDCAAFVAVALALVAGIVDFAALLGETILRCQG